MYYHDPVESMMVPFWYGNHLSRFKNSWSKDKMVRPYYLHNRNSYTSVIILPMVSCADIDHQSYKNKSWDSTAKWYGNYISINDKTIVRLSHLYGWNLYTWKDCHWYSPLVFSKFCIRMIIIKTVSWSSYLYNDNSYLYLVRLSWYWNMSLAFGFLCFLLPHNTVR